MPNSGELKAYCDELVARDDRISRNAALPRPQPRLPKPPPGPGEFANLFVPRTAPQYAAMIEKSRNPKSDLREFKFDHERDGIWVMQSWLGSISTRQPSETAE